MAIVSLLRLPLTELERWAFTFEHDRAHRKSHGPTSYVLDPMRRENGPGSKWHLDHQQAHNRMARPPPSVLTVLRDSNLFNLRQKTWWEFANHHEHFLNQ